jgi:hypothetical protein
LTPGPGGCGRNSGATKKLFIELHESLQRSFKVLGPTSNSDTLDR